MALLLFEYPICTKITPKTLSNVCSIAQNLNPELPIAAPKSLKAAWVKGLKKMYKTNPINNCKCKELRKVIEDILIVLLLGSRFVKA